MLSETLFKLGPYKVCSWNIIILVIIFITASILRRIVQRLLKKSLQSANIPIQGRTMTWMRLISQSVYLIAIYIAVWSFNLNNRNVKFSEFLNFNLIESKKFNLSFFHILALTAIFFGTKMLMNVVRLFISRKFKERQDYDQATEFVYVQIAKYIIYIFAVLISLNVLDVDLTIFLTGSAALLVGAGLGLQDVFKDMFSGIVLLVEGNIRVGDVVEIYGMNEPIVAKVLRIKVRTTQIETREGNVLIIPNAKLTQEHVENWSQGTTLTCFVISVSVAYDSDLELVSRLLKQAALAHPKIKKNPTASVRLSDFGDSGINMDLLFWADQSWEINSYKSDIRFEINRLFKANNISIPFPQREVRILNKD